VNKEIINDYDNLYIAIANHAGKDKLSWEDRIEWSKSSLNTIIDGKIRWDEPHLGRKAVKALLDTIDDQPTGYWMTLDATASGIQIMAALSGCTETASATNMVDPAVRRDLYQEVTTAINSLCTIPTTRKVVKKVVMTFFYNSIKTPERMLTKDQLAAFYQVIQQLFPGAYKVMDIVNNLWNTNGSHHRWTLPDGHVAYVPVLDAVKYNTPYGSIYRTELVTSPNYRSLLPNVIHSIDGYIAREMIRRCDFEVIHIHDCFGSHPNNMGVIAQCYREILAEISDSTLLNSIVKELSMGKSWFPIFPSLKYEILNSNYMLS
jgi:DNA-directed RNA polymerase